MIVRVLARQTDAWSAVRRIIGVIDTHVDGIPIIPDKSSIPCGPPIHILYETARGVRAGEEIKHAKEGRRIVIVFENVAASSCRDVERD